MAKSPGTTVVVTALAVALTVAGCVGSDSPDTEPTATASTTGPTASGGSSSGSTGAEDETPRSWRTSTPSPTGPSRFVASNTQRSVKHLAGRIGPREAPSRAYRRAARWVSNRLDTLGYETRRMRVGVPEGLSWGVEVPAGRTSNVIADPPGLDTSEPYILIGAHLDTVPQAPGAEDNASGVAVMLELARLSVEQGTRLPVRFVAFGAEEPRGSGDDMHHFGSRTYVRAMPSRAKNNLQAMVSLDRVGVQGESVPVCTGGTGTTKVADALVKRAGKIPTEQCENRASDHWSFEKADLPAARLGSIPYAGYHSAQDVAKVTSKRQLNRVGRVMWRWLRVS